MARKKTTKKKTIRKRTTRKRVSIAQPLTGSSTLFIIWGFLIFLGFLLTEILFESAMPPVSAFFLWFVFLGIGLWISASIPHEELIHKTSSQVVWAVAIAGSIVVTAIVLNGPLNLHPAFIGVSWLAITGSAMIISGFTENSSSNKNLGLVWVLTAALLAFIPELFIFEYIVLAIGFGVPLIVEGIIRGLGW